MPISWFHNTWDITKWQFKVILPFKVSVKFSSVTQSCQLFVTPWTAAHQASLSTINSRSWLKLISIELMMLSNHLILCRPLLLPPSIFPSIRVLSNESVLCISSATYQLFDLGQATYTLWWNYSVFKLDSSFLLRLKKILYFSISCRLARNVMNFGQWMNDPYFLLPTIVALKAKR